MFQKTWILAIFYYFYFDYFVRSSAKHYYPLSGNLGNFLLNHRLLKSQLSLEISKKKFSEKQIIKSNLGGGHGRKNGTFRAIWAGKLDFQKYCKKIEKILNKDEKNWKKNFFLKMFWKGANVIITKKLKKCHALLGQTFTFDRV